MDDKNFDSLKNLKAPDKWIENALNIPKNDKKATPVFFMKYSKIIAAAACIVLVCTISLSFYFTRENLKSPISQTPQSTLSPDVQNSTENLTENHQAPTQNNDKSDTDTQVVVPQTDGENGNVPNEKPSESTKPDSGDKPLKPQGGPTVPSEEPSTESEKPTEKPSKPTVKPTAPPDKPKPTVPTLPPGPPQSPPGEGTPGVPSIPSNPGNPGAPSTPTPMYSTFSIEVDTKYLNSSQIVYCTITDQNHQTITPDMQAFVYKGGNKAYATYDLYVWDVPNSGYYICHFFTYDTYIGYDTKYISKQ